MLIMVFMFNLYNKLYHTLIQYILLSFVNYLKLIKDIHIDKIVISFSDNAKM